MRDTVRAPQPPTNPSTGQKNLILMEGIKSFGTHVTEKTPRHLFCIVFWSGMRSNGPRMPIFGQKCQFWAKFGPFLAKNPNFYGSKESFGTHTEKPPGQLVRIGFWPGIGSNGSKMPIFGKHFCCFLVIKIHPSRRPPMTYSDRKRGG